MTLALDPQMFYVTYSVRVLPDVVARDHFSRADASTL
jgi:hypothetical protein